MEVIRARVLLRYGGAGWEVLKHWLGYIDGQARGGRRGLGEWIRKWPSAKVPLLRALEVGFESRWLVLPVFDSGIERVSRKMGLRVGRHAHARAERGGGSHSGANCEDPMGIGVGRDIARLSIRLT